MSSPARKRMRMSSPTYDDHFVTSQEDLDAFDAFMASQPAPSAAIPSGFGSAAEMLQHTFKPASLAPDPSSEQEEPNYDNWFDAPPQRVNKPTFFAPASLSANSLLSSTSSTKVFQPSAAALAKYREKEDRWLRESEEQTDLAPSSPLRKRKENHVPTTPPSRHPSIDPATVFQTPGSLLHPHKEASKSPLVAKATPFRPPLSIATPPANTPSKASFTSARFATPQPSALAPATPSPSLNRPTKLLGMSRRTPNPKTFKSPWKGDRKPLESGPSKLSTVVNAATSQNTSVHTTVSLPGPDPPNRANLQTCGKLPSQYTEKQLRSMGIDIDELIQITPTLAPFYRFRVTAISSDLEELRGPEHILEELLSQGCHLASKKWVENHWVLILWKLAGLVGLDPESEKDADTRRWSWKEVMRQFLFRYQRELGKGARPPLRRICTQDSPASLPMILCVSKVTIPDSVEGEEDQPPPELEICDGWYRMKAQVDETLARAIRKGVIRLGCKLAVANAKLDSDRKEPCEILEAYDTVRLVLSGNSSRLAPWHAKLGFQRGPCVSTLHSLTPDGGLISVLDLVVIKAHAIAYIEFKEDDDGTKWTEGPRVEKDEIKEREKWEKRREKEAMRLWEERQDTWERYDSYAERLDAKAGSSGGNEEGFEDTDSLYDTLEDSESAKQTLSQLTGPRAAALSKHIRQQRLREQEIAQEEIERELVHLCPPRAVRDFRVIVVRDARTIRRPGNRTAQLTIWNVKALTLYEGAEGGSFSAGDRFMVSNVVPIQPTAWMGNDDEAPEIYLKTRADSIWRKMNPNTV